MKIEIEYDVNKRQKTLEARGIDFNDAPEVFSGVHINREDTRHDYGEIRNITVGLLNYNIVVIVWTERHKIRRIISMRKAHDNERKLYYKELDRSG